jgi:hypothetical protein
MPYCTFTGRAFILRVEVDKSHQWVHGSGARHECSVDLICLLQCVSPVSNYCIGGKYVSAPKLLVIHTSHNAMGSFSFHFLSPRVKVSS